MPDVARGRHAGVAVLPIRGAGRTAVVNEWGQASGRSGRVLGLRVDAVEFELAVRLIGEWLEEAPSGRARMVCAANVHMVMEAWDEPRLGVLVNTADVVLPDGQPLVWALRALGVPQQRRVRMTPDLLLRVFEEAEKRGLPLGLYGGTEQSLPVFVASLRQRFPRLRVPFAYAPPFRPLTPEENAAILQRIRSSGVRALLVGIGCPKQERWMAEHRRDLSCVMLGVGAAFDLFGGVTREAPAWTRDRGLEWFFRLSQEPRRLWRRHARNDPRFLALLTWQVVRERVRGPR